MQGKPIPRMRFKKWVANIYSFIFISLLFISNASAQDIPVLAINTGHTNVITSVAFSPDGLMVASAGNDSTILIRKTDTWQEVRRFGVKGGANSIVFNPNGESIISANYGNSISIWDIKNGKEQKRFVWDGYEALIIKVTQNGLYAVSGHLDGVFRLWNLSNGAMLYATGIPIDANEMPFQLSISLDEMSFIWSRSDNAVHKVDLFTGKEIKLLLSPKSGRNIGFSHDSRLALSVGFDEVATLWEIDTGREIRTFHKNVANFKSVAFSNMGDKLITSEYGDRLSLWDTSVDKIILSMEGPSHGARALSFSPDDSMFIAGESSSTLESNSLYAFDLTTGKELHRSSNQGNSVLTLALSSNEKNLLVGDTKSAQLWDFTTGQMRQRLKLREKSLKVQDGSESRVNSVRFVSDGLKALIGMEDGEISLWDVPTSKKLKRWEPIAGGVESLSISKDGQLFVAGVERLGSVVLNISSELEVNRFERRKQVGNHINMINITPVAISPDGELSAGTVGETVFLWNVRDGKVIRRLDGHTDLVYSVAFSSDGRTLITGSNDTTLRLWDINSGKQIHRMDGHSSTVHSVAISPDGLTIASGGLDGSVRLWDASTGRLRRTILDAKYSINEVVFSSNGLFIAVASAESVKLVRISDGSVLATLTGFADGTWLVSEPGGRYDSSNYGENPNLHWVIGLTPVSIGQLKDRYYDPGLLSKLMGFNKDPLRNVPALAEAFAKLPPSVELLPGSDTRNVMLRITDEGGGIGRVRVRLNGKELVSDASAQLSTSADGKARELKITLPVDRLLTGVNTVDVMAFNADNHIQSRLASINLQGPAAVARTTKPVSGLASSSASAAEVTDAVPPTLYVIAVGVSKYAAEGGRLNLAFSGKDAVDLSQSLLIAGKRLFGAGKVNVRVLTDSDATVLQAAAKAGHTVAVQAPGRTQVSQAFADVAKEAKANDIVAVFLGGHGVMTPSIGLDTGDYHYLMPEARSADLTDPAVRKLWAVSSAELTEWTKAIKANKQVLVLDTCAAGGAVDKLVQQRALPGSHTIALERLKDRTGFHILAGSAADKVSYEASRYGQGLLTYALLAGLRGAALRDGEYADVSKLFQYAVDQVPELAKGIGGIQKPMMASPRGSSFDIGRLVDEDKRQVPVAKIMPLMLRSQIQSEDFKDTLRLEARLNARLREFNYSGAKGELMFVDADEHPDGWKLRARYRKAGEGYVLEGVMFQGEQEHGKVKVELKSDQDGQLRDLMAAVRTGMLE